MALLVDEGSGLVNAWGRTFGLPAVAEKGKWSFNLTLSTKGGHSSVPPKTHQHGIGLTGIVKLEKNPHPVVMTPDSPIWGYLPCAANTRRECQ